MLYCQLRHTTLWPPAQYTGAVILRNPPYFSLQIEPWSPPAHLSRALLPLQQSCLSATANLCSAAVAPLLCCCGGNDEFYGRHPFSWFALNTSKLICNPSIHHHSAKSKDQNLFEDSHFQYLKYVQFVTKMQIMLIAFQDWPQPPSR